MRLKHSVQRKDNRIDGRATHGGGMSTTKTSQVVLVALCDYAARYGKGLEFQGIVESFEKDPSQLRVMGIFRDRGAYRGKFKLVDVLPGGNLLFRGIVLLEKVLGKVGIRLPARHIQDTLFDWVASRRIPQDCAILMTLPGMTRTLTRAKALGAQTVLHGVVMHPTYNRKLLARCYANPSQYPAVWDARMIAALETSMDLFDVVICPSSAAAESYVENGFSADKVFVAPLGFERPRLKPEILPWGSGEPLKVVFVGNVTKMKGCDILFNAAAMLDESRFEFHICGDVQYDLEAEVNQLQRVRSNVIFHGYVPSLQIYPKCHVFVFMSLSEGLPKALLEASFSALLVVANKYSHADLVVHGETGLICEHDAGRLAAILNDVERHRDKYLGMRRQLQLACQRLSWERFGSDVKDVLLRLAKTKTDGGPEMSDTAAASVHSFDH
jgi:glycosyltransferase involved in cell wall biosynthesis